MSCFRSLVRTSLCGWLLLVGRAVSGGPEVKVVKMPESGYRPHAVLDRDGTLHIVYARIEERGELFYIRRKAGREVFSRPIKVNSTPGCAAAFNMAVGRGGRVHVLIRPTAGYSRDRLGRKPVFNDLKYMLYCRLDDASEHFEDERDLSGETFGFEGVGTLIADGKGTVRAFWHGLEKAGPESSRQIFVAVSRDEGKTFTRPLAIQNDATGACACCSMHGTMDDAGNLYLGYRNSEKSLSKDSYLLTSKDGGKTFTGTLLDRWPGAGCPGSTYSLTAAPSGVCIAWNTKSEVCYSRGKAKPDRIAAPAFGKTARAGVVVANSRDEVLLAWTEAARPAQFRTAGDLAWVIFDREDRPISKKGTLPGAVARWSVPAAYAEPDGDFVILYDGPGVK